MDRGAEPLEEATPAEREVVERLTAGRPAPSAGFRGLLRQKLAADDPGYGPRPPRLRLIVACYFVLGLLLIGLAALLAL